MAIVALCGLQGSGKTTLLMRRVLQRFRADACQVYSDMTGIKIPDCTYIDAEHPLSLAMIGAGVFGFDEAQVSVDARFWNKVPPEVLAAWSQLRKNGVDVYYTTQIFDSVDSRLRGQTTEVHNCHKAGNFFVVRRVFPGTKKVIGLAKWYPQSRRIWHLYDSYEVIGKRVGVGAGQSEALAEVRRRRAERAQSSRRSQRRNPFDCDIFDKRGNYTPDALTVRRDLLDQGRIRPGQDHYLVEIDRELRRRKWLRYCRLRPDDVPPWVTYEEPWLAHWSPAAVRQRVAVREAAAFELAQMELEAKQARSAGKTKVLQGRAVVATS